MKHHNISDNSRLKLVEAAKTLLWEVGFEAMSPRKVLKHSGVGHGSLYHHFEGKRDLAGAALEQIERELTADLIRVLNVNEPPLDRVRAYLSKPRPATQGCRLGRLANEVEVTSSELRMPLSRYFKRAENLLTEILQEAKDEGALLADINPADLACTLLAVIQGSYVLARANNKNIYSKKASRGALALLDAATTNPEERT